MDRLTPAVSKRDHIEGAPAARFELVEYGDYECPYCAKARGAVQELRRRLGDDLKFTFRNFPLTEIHPRALAAARAAEAADRQGKFWEMHALLFERQDRLEDDDLLGYAGALGLDVDQFTEDLGRVLRRIEADVRSGEQSGVQGTPSFYVNGRRFEGNWRDSGQLVAALGGADGEAATEADPG
jgi:NhaA family Na+:H+ antiporter